MDHGNTLVTELSYILTGAFHRHVERGDFDDQEQEADNATDSNDEEDSDDASLTNDNTVDDTVSSKQDLEVHQVDKLDINT